MPSLPSMRAVSVSEADERTGATSGQVCHGELRVYIPVMSGMTSNQICATGCQRQG